MGLVSRKLAWWVLLFTGSTLAREHDDHSIRLHERAAAFAGTADQINNYDPHDYVPTNYNKVRVAHAVLMSTVWLIMFPIGGIIPRIMQNPRLLGTHVVVQMVGFWIVVGAAAMGIWMAREIGGLGTYHPIIGMILLGLLAVQPATEILNHRFYQTHPKMIITAHVHLWLGRGLLIAGAIQGGLGFLYASSFKKATTDIAPRATYIIVTVSIWILYVLVGIIYPEVRSSIRSKRRQRTEAVSAGNMENLRADSLAHPVTALPRLQTERKNSIPYAQSPSYPTQMISPSAISYMSNSISYVQEPRISPRA